MAETNLAKIKEEINTQIADPETFKILVDTTFNGLSPQNAKRAMLEGMMRGFRFEDFLEKNVYAIPYGQGYSLVNSIGHFRKIGAKSGVIGKSEPRYEEGDDRSKPIACSVTVHKEGGHPDGFTATVEFSEYYAGHKKPDGTIKKTKGGYDLKPNQWDTKPRTMIAKVAEMHALRMACPEELSQSYIEEEFDQEATIEVDSLDSQIIEEINAIESVEELREYYQANKGKGKEFDQYVTKRKKELQDS